MTAEDKKQLLRKLHQVKDIVDKIWALQYSEKRGGLATYPVDFNKDEFLKQAGSNPELLSPYTVIKKKGDEYIAVSYADEYRREIDKICRLLDEAALSVKSKEKDLAKYLSSLSTNLAEQNYEQLEVEFVNYDGWTNVNLGAFETYEDHELGIKKSFQFMLTHKYSGASNFYTRNLKKLAENIAVTLPGELSGSIISKGNIKIDFVNVATMGGRFKLYPVSTVSYPNSKQLADKYGSKINILMNTISNRVTSFLLLGKKYLYDKSSVELDKLMRGYLLMMVLHQVFDTSVRYDGVEKRLGRYYDMVRETSSFMLTVQTSLNYLAKGWISSEELDYIMNALILFGIDSIRKRDRGVAYKGYADGFAMFFNYMIKTGGIKVREGQLDYKCTGDVCNLNLFLPVIMRVYSKGAEEDVQQLLGKYGGYDKLDAFLT